MLWKQGSRILWLKESDKNSKFFHIKAFNRKRRNRMSSIKHEVEECLEESRLDHIVSYFNNLFTTNTEKGSLEFSSGLGQRVMDNMIFNMEKDFIEEEIRFTLK